MAIPFVGGKLLFVNNKLAMSENCCCESVDEEVLDWCGDCDTDTQSCGAEECSPESVTVTISGVSFCSVCSGGSGIYGSIVVTACDINGSFLATHASASSPNWYVTIPNAVTYDNYLYDDCVTKTATNTSDLVIVVGYASSKWTVNAGIPLLATPTDVAYSMLLGESTVADPDTRCLALFTSTFSNTTQCRPGSPYSTDVGFGGSAIVEPCDTTV